ncbi:hypothetical protein MUK42_33937 [Musa troglodytarum]|uniref:Uncharacterized protein n=1 Tax=Musa troglodytarum TaxID=320322 RepID=A0A9E7FL35_9LILI|nr:hypothetical protein MUK42_33937 [Musa troglodytarum]
MSQGSRFVPEVREGERERELGWRIRRSSHRFLDSSIFPLVKTIYCFVMIDGPFESGSAPDLEIVTQSSYLVLDIAASEPFLS